MKNIMHRLETFLQLGGIRKDITLLILGGVSLIMSLAGIRPLPFDMAWVSIVLCGVPIIMEALIGLITAFDVKADVPVSLALIASVCIGEDFAAEAADIAPVDDRIAELPHLLALSKRMMRTIRINLSFSMGLNFLAIAPAITGVLGPVAGALVHNAGSVLVIIHSALLLKWRKKRYQIPV